LEGFKPPTSFCPEIPAIFMFSKEDRSHAGRIGGDFGLERRAVLG
jgi:hypothetical protein